MNRVPRAIFAASTLLYVITGGFLTAGRGYLMGDALSRVSATDSALFSRDPHLSAIGFVFTPLTALAQLPFVAFARWIPAITRWGLSGVLMTSLFMAGAVVMVWGIGRDRGVPVWLCGLVTAVFALNPMVVFYGGNGMSEALFLFCLCWAVRRLMRWVTTDGVHDLVACGIALGLGYLTRYDALAPAATAGVFVFAIGYYRRRAAEHRFAGAAMDLVLVAAPVALAFVVWAATSWLITGQAFQQFTSQYGNSAILAQEGATGPQHPLAAAQYSTGAMLILAPALPLLLPIVGALALRRRELTPVVPMLLCGSVLGFQMLSYATGSTFAFLRFYVAAIPLTAILALLIPPAVGAVPSRRLGAFAHEQTPPVDRPNRSSGLATMAAVLVGLVLVASLPITARGMNSQLMAVQEYALRAVLFPDPNDTSDKYLDAEHIAYTFAAERRLADHLDAMNLPRGSIVMDTVYGFAVQIASKHPDRFVIPSDRDFVQTLNRPLERGVKYILAVPNSGRGTSDAVNRRYPTMYENGAQIATLELEIPNDGAGQPNWRLYRVIGS
ncbi:ABC transporter [Nocardia sp. CDC153]|uniref:ArnT family glycosyltransferase n=1 Tax=Nocardia sp. CDC153 TaxID=3112167 RepID=UPI002DBFD8B0|nr:ABC transporter [Nocardia sp. CDC153]MEC3958498.1 ABC transporter [Nocardia sp. CDC153]